MSYSVCGISYLELRIENEKWRTLPFIIDYLLLIISLCPLALCGSNDSVNRCKSVAQVNDYLLLTIDYFHLFRVISEIRGY